MAPDPVTPSGVQERCPECRGARDEPKWLKNPGQSERCSDPFHSPSPEPETAECETCGGTKVVPRPAVRHPDDVDPPVPCPDCSTAPETAEPKSYWLDPTTHTYVSVRPRHGEGCPPWVEVVEKAELDRVREELGRLRSRVERCGMHATASIEAFQDGMEMAGRAITPDAFLDEIETVMRQRNEARAELERLRDGGKGR